MNLRLYVQLSNLVTDRFMQCQSQNQTVNTEAQDWIILCPDPVATMSEE